MFSFLWIYCIKRPDFKSEEVLNSTRYIKVYWSSGLSFDVLSLHKKKFFIKDFFSKFEVNLQFSAALDTYLEETLNGSLHFLCSVSRDSRTHCKE